MDLVESGLRYKYRYLTVDCSRRSSAQPTNKAIIYIVAGGRNSTHFRSQTPIEIDSPTCSDYDSG